MTTYLSKNISRYKGSNLRYRLFFTALTLLFSFSIHAQSLYIDCSATVDGDGTASNPINSINTLNNHELHPGDSILFRRGTTCNGEVVAATSGSENAPVIYDAWGEGTALPRIEANGNEAAFHMTDVSWVTVQNLELSASGDGKSPRRGLWVSATDSGEHQGIRLQHLNIHDVRGEMPATKNPSDSSIGKYAHASGGIVVEALGNTTPTWFSGLDISDNIIHAVDREGIYTWSNWCQRPELVEFWYSLCTAKWQPFNNTHISHNMLSDIGGDGIAPMTSTDSTVEYNVLNGFNIRSGSPNAGMWSANSDNIVYQYNFASGGHTTQDGMSYDVDHSTNGIVYQYNISSGNEGGFFLLCPYGDDVPGKSRNFVIRYNLSVADRTRTFQVCNGGVINGQIYNNTILLPPDTTSAHLILTEGATNDGAVELKLTNNILMGDGSGVTPVWDYNDSAITGDHNLYNNVPVMPSDSYALINDPLLANPGPENVLWRDYLPQPGSPAINAGIAVTGAPAHDALNQAIGTPPTIGALEPESSSRR
ncbi:pectate lyase [Salmonella enterica subsp. diarizonae serovar 61:z52:z53]|nr:pectate lyase [Salmonella enterica subsp. diarizonae serovar 61:z52:z53]EHG6220147.1 pectate lyase [Salmonella enterica subsp. diarizonae serovar 61:z52:z53]